MNRQRREWIVLGALFVLALLPLRLTARSFPHLTLTMYNSRVWQAQDGLPQDTIQALAQTPDGYLWIGTSGGLIRFDGTRFVIYTRDNTPVFLDDSVWSLRASRDGTLWVGTEGGGLLRYRSGVFRSFSVDDGLTNGFIRAIFEDRRSVLWVGTDRGLFRRIGDKFERVDDRPPIPNVNVYAIGEDTRERLMIGCTDSGGRSGLMTLSGDEVGFYSSDEGEADSRIDAIQASPDGALWLGTLARVRRLAPGARGNPFIKGTLVHAVASDDRLIAPREVVTGVSVSAIAESRDGSLWIGTNGQGVLQFQNGNVREFRAPGFLPDNNVSAVIEDSEGNIWIGTQNGLVRLNQSLAQTARTQDGAPVNISTVFEDSQRMLWAASYGGQLFKFSGRALVPAALPAKLGELSARTVFQTRNGDFWIGTAGQGVIQISKTGVRLYNTGEGLANPFIRAFCEDRDGSLWVGTDGGLSHFRNGRFRTFRTENGLTHESVRSILIDRGGDVWVGTERGVTRFHAGAVVSEPGLERLRQEKIWAIHEDVDGGMWFGTRGRGLFVLREGKISNYSTAQGFPSNNIFSITEDDHAALWMSSSTGVFSVDRKNLENSARNGHSQIAIRIYGRSEGLGTKQMNGGVQSAGIITQAGELWFASSSGAVRMLPSSLHAGKPMPVLIEQVSADGQDIPLSGHLVLGPGHEKIEIRYGAITLRSPERVHFRYKLEGFEQSWAEAGDRRIAYYTNLPAGEYRFRVVAYDVSVPEELSEASIKLRCEPRFYKTAGFAAFCLLAAISLASCGYLLHVRRMRQEFAAVLHERGRLAREMHDTLIQGCVGISTLLEAASVLKDSSSPSSRDLLDRARMQAQLTVEEARRAVWNLRHESELGASLVGTLSQLAQHVSAESATAVRFEHFGSPMPIGNEVHRNILLIAREALHNAVRHASPQGISVVLWFRDATLCLDIADDGDGFSEPQPPDGEHYGLAGMRERANSIGGEFEITSDPGKGTIVRVRVPLYRKTRAAEKVF